MSSTSSFAVSGFKSGSSFATATPPSGFSGVSEIATEEKAAIKSEMGRKRMLKVVYLTEKWSRRAATTRENSAEKTNNLKVEIEAELAQYGTN